MWSKIQIQLETEAPDKLYAYVTNIPNNTGISTLLKMVILEY